MFELERPQTGERAILVHLEFPFAAQREELDEFRELAVSAGAIPVAVVVGSRKAPDPKFFVGTGKVAEIRDAIINEEAEIVLFNHALSPAQERNLERELKCRVLDRTGLILDIFAQRAQTHEGKLQVELAQLVHMSTRLVRGWTHLERQKGGIGLRGPGETQLETDRRLLNDRIKQINKRLDKVKKQRDQGRRSRRRADIPTVSLVGYTNAGKSTLFNRLSGSEVFAADQLFATLDPTLRRLELPTGQPVIIADTVGFIRHLPHDLVAAFRSTLEETCQADVLLHIIDAHDDERQMHVEQVNEVLKEIGAEDVYQIQVYNKVDLIDEASARIERDNNNKVLRVWVSAATGEGVDLLQQALAEVFQEEVFHEWIRLGPGDGRLRSRLFDMGAIRNERFDDEGNWLLEIELQQRDLNTLTREEGLSLPISSKMAEIG
ncbi:MAG: GTPase HflX [Gammaproteobacteria bacterium]|nr:GTPase HflX [Gammaproteobacteria bacterium]